MMSPYATMTEPFAIAVDANALALEIASITGLIATTASSTEVNVSGTKTNMPSVVIDIPVGLTVNWNASVTGSAKSGTYLLNLDGGGVFNFISGNINNTGAGGQLNAIGMGLEINVIGTLLSSTNGISLNIAADDVKVEIAGEIRNSGSNSAINVSPGYQGVCISVVGGTVVSSPSGYAINDGSTDPPCSNSTAIVISNGTVTSGSACAIRSSGVGSTVLITGNSNVSNSASSNTNSTIYMNGEPGIGPVDNIIIEGNSKVYTTNATSSTSYVVQTTKGVLIRESARVSAIAGRGVNLVGMYSRATVEDNAIVETESGTAISTATSTTNLVANTSVVIKGGTVQATDTGTAIRITGLNSTVDISGGWVTAKQGFAVDASGSPQGSSPKPITISGGFVFAWGSGVNKAVTEAKLEHIDPGIVVAWNTVTGTGSYHQLSESDLKYLPEPPPGGIAAWDNEPVISDNGGIRFINGSNSGFFPLDVIVVNETYYLTVNHGTDLTNTGPYIVGTIIELQADPEDPVIYGLVGSYPDTIYNYPSNGTAFSCWETNAGGVFENAVSTRTSFTMPANDVTITATYTDRHLFGIQNGSIISPINYGTSNSYGYYPEGAEIIVRANTSTFGPYFFNGWTNDSYNLITDRNALVTTYTMPNGPASIGLNPGSYPYPTPTMKTLEVVSGKITTTSAGMVVDNTTGVYIYGTGLNLEAYAASTGYIFDKWIIVSGGGAFINASDPNTRFIMPDANVVIEATFKRIVPTYNLTVIDGEDITNASSYHADEEVHIIANFLEIGKFFSGWTIDGGGGEFKDSSSWETDFYMPDCDAVISAHYEWEEYTLIYENFSDGSMLEIGIFHYGEEIAIFADNPFDGLVFAGWASESNGVFENSRSTTTTFTMPAENTTVTAFYARTGGGTGGSSGGSGNTEPSDNIEDLVDTENDDGDDSDDPKNPDSAPEEIPKETTSSITVSLKASVIVSGIGATLQDSQFGFALCDEDNTLIATSSNDANGNIEFPLISFSEAGTFIFKILQTTPNGNGWIIDSREFIIVAMVTELNNGLVAIIQNPGDNIPVFHNRYSISALEESKSETPSTRTPFIEDHLAYITGYPDNTVQPERDITRAEVAVIFYRLLSEDLLDVGMEHINQFPDIDPGRWYGDAITVMHNLGIINGYPYGTFRPDSFISRAELATIAAHFAAMMHMEPTTHIAFTDTLDHWAAYDIAYAAEIGWVNGYSDGSYKPLRNITRAEFITLVNRALQRIPESVDDLLDGMIIWADNANPSAWYYLAIQEATNSHTHGYKEHRLRELDIMYEYWVSLIA